MTATVLLLDIDGCVNGSPRLAGWDRPPRRVKAGFPVYYEPQVVDRLRAIRDAGIVDMRWCTTWCGHPALDILENLLDLHLPRAFGDRPMSKTWGDLKVEAALQVLADENRLIWVDDEEAAAGRRLFPQIAAAEREGRALLVAPASEYGLRPADFEAIEAFAGNLEAAA